MLPTYDFPSDKDVLSTSPGGIDSSQNGSGWIGRPAHMRVFFARAADQDGSAGRRMSRNTTTQESLCAPRGVRQLRAARAPQYIGGRVISQRERDMYVRQLSRERARAHARASGVNNHKLAN